MVSCTIVLRQVLGEWDLTLSLSEHYGSDAEPERFLGHYHYPLTGPEWDSDALTSVLSALRRWSDMTTPGH